jgi:hypothetical protein
MDYVNNRFLEKRRDDKFIFEVVETIKEGIFLELSIGRGPKFIRNVSLNVLKESA